MIDIQITFDDQVSEKIDRFASSADHLLDRILVSTGGKYASYVRRSFLSGQMLGARTGEARKKLKVHQVRGQHHLYAIWSALQNIYESRSGVDIVPKGGSRVSAATDRRGRRSGWAGHTVGGAHMLRWIGEDSKIHWSRHVHLNPRPFMTLSSSIFNFSAAADESAERIFELELRKRGLSE